MINSFENYLKEGKAKRKTPDFEEAKALLEKAKGRLAYTKIKETTEATAQFVLEDAYESIREAAQALMSIRGFKPYSHEATISFIKDFHKEEFNQGEINRFDRFRQIRNNSVYKAAPVQINDANDCLSFANELIKRIGKIIEKFGGSHEPIAFRKSKEKGLSKERSSYG